MEGRVNAKTTLIAKFQCDFPRLHSYCTKQLISRSPWAWCAMTNITRRSSTKVTVDSACFDFLVAWKIWVKTTPYPLLLRPPPPRWRLQLAPDKISSQACLMLKWGPGGRRKVSFGRARHTLLPPFPSSSFSLLLTPHCTGGEEQHLSSPSSVLIHQTHNIFISFFSWLLPLTAHGIMEGGYWYWARSTAASDCHSFFSWPSRKSLPWPCFQRQQGPNTLFLSSLAAALTCGILAKSDCFSQQCERYFPFSPGQTNQYHELFALVSLSFGNAEAGRECDQRRQFGKCPVTALALL